MLEAVKTNAGIDGEKDRVSVAAYSENVKQLLGLQTAAINTSATSQLHKIESGKAVVTALGSLSSIMSSIEITNRTEPV
jgi:hypothetical protein